MKKVYSSENSIEVGLIKGMLEQDGIACMVKNQILGGAIGGLPPQECWPELWITDDRDLALATQIVETALSTPGHAAAPWHCQCGELIEAQFTDCWSCGASQPA